MLVAQRGKTDVSYTFDFCILPFDLLFRPVPHR